jgi:uncharacterized protein YecT (DUF1311 family)
MKKLLKISLCFMLWLLFILSPNITAQTQSDLDDTAHAEYQKQDKMLNNTYKEILKIYKDDTLFINRLRIAQRAWLEYRDKYMESLYPEKDKSYYGSIYPMCYYNALALLTKQRADQLKLWLEGAEEGDGCSGSIKTKDAIKEIKNSIK